MTAQELRLARKRRGWTQARAAERLGVSQAYLALLEGGKRALGESLSRKAVLAFKLRPAALPLSERLPARTKAESLARQLASLGYPGFASLGAGRPANPAEVLITALAKDDLEPRLTEALPWLLLHHPDMNFHWLVGQARLHNLSNRLGFVVTLAKQVAATAEGTGSPSYQALDRLEARLSESRLDKEDTLCQSSLSPKERAWLRKKRPAEAAYWHLLTDWRPEHLQYV